jgi:hypothetical protein
MDQYLSKNLLDQMVRVVALMFWLVTRRVLLSQRRGAAQSNLSLALQKVTRDPNLG